MTSPHDALFKQVFSLPAEAAAEFRHVLPAELARWIDWSTLRLEPGSFVDEELRDRHADLLFSVQIGETRALIYCLLEHKSTPDYWTPLQLLIYAVRVWERYRREHADLATLPPIFAIVVHHGRTPWAGPRDVADLVDLEPDIRAHAGPFLPRFRFFVDDLAAVSEGSMLLRPPSAAAPLILFCLQRTRSSDDILAELVAWRTTLRRVAHGPSGVETLTAIMSYIMEVQGVPLTRVRQFLRVEVDPEMESSVVTMIDLLKEKFRDEGRAEGLAEGMAEGQARLLLRLLRARFGEPPQFVVARVRAANTIELETWADRVLSAASLDELFGSGEPSA